MKLSDEMKEEYEHCCKDGWSNFDRHSYKQLIPKVEALEKENEKLKKENESLKQQYKDNNDKWENFARSYL